MKVQIPKHFKFLTHPVEIKFDPKVALSLGACGVVRHTFQDMCLDPLMPSSELMQIFCHEYNHVVERHLGIKADDQDTDRYAEGMAMLFEILDIEFDWSLIEEE